MPKFYGINHTIGINNLIERWDLVENSHKNNFNTLYSISSLFFCCFLTPNQKKEQSRFFTNEEFNELYVFIKKLKIDSIKDPIIIKVKNIAFKSKLISKENDILWSELIEEKDELDYSQISLFDLSKDFNIEVSKNLKKQQDFFEKKDFLKNKWKNLKTNLLSNLKINFEK